VLATASKEVTGNQTSLVCRVPTRWNSEKDCVDAHCHLKPIVLLITGDPKLKAFKLSDEQWALAEELRDVLNVVICCCCVLLRLLNAATRFSRDPLYFFLNPRSH